MPLTNPVIIRLNEITVIVEDKSSPTKDELDLIRSAFEVILRDGHDYNVDEIESWFEHEGSWHDRAVRTRITNLAHYVQSKHEQTSRLKMASDDCGC